MGYAHGDQVQGSRPLQEHPASHHADPSRFPKDLLALALADPAIAAMRANTWVDTDRQEAMAEQAEREAERKRAWRRDYQREYHRHWREEHRQGKALRERKTGRPDSGIGSSEAVS